MAVAEDDAALLPVDPALEHKFTCAYHKPRFVPGRGEVAEAADIAEPSDIATVRDSGRLPDDSEQGLSCLFTGLVVGNANVRARYCGVCQLWFASDSKPSKFMENKVARHTQTTDQFSMPRLAVQNYATLVCPEHYEHYARSDVA